ncbi:MAG TPA: calcium/sodium antiporter [Actinomycetota bacterium]|nr:calcium/sodium antiporter [Actinomycetota bacterium]
MLVDAALLVGGIALLTVAAERFVIGASRLAVLLRVSPVVVGVVIIGFGTSSPEVLAAGLAALQRQPEVAVGTIVGSNIANLTLILGVAALARPIVVTSKTIEREAPLSAIAVGMFAIALQGRLGRGVGLLLLLGLAWGLWMVLRAAAPDEELARETDEFVRVSEPHRRGVEAIRTVLGLGGTILGAQLLLVGATGLAESLGIAGGFAGFTIVALGTSLPELVTALQAARHGEPDLIVGNLLGSNLFNSLAVAATVILVRPGPLDAPTLTGIGTLVMVGVAAAGWLMMATARKVVRWEAVVLIVAYLAILPLLYA